MLMHYAYHNHNNYACKLNTTYLLCDYDVYCLYINNSRYLPNKHFILNFKC